MSFQKFYQDLYADLEKGHGYDMATEPTFALRVGAALRAVGTAPKRILILDAVRGMPPNVLRSVVTTSWESTFLRLVFGLRKRRSLLRPLS